MHVCTPTTTVIHTVTSNISNFVVQTSIEKKKPVHGKYMHGERKTHSFLNITSAAENFSVFGEKTVVLNSILS